MSFLFTGCSNLLSLPNISNWDVSNVTDIRAMFYGCSQISTLPNISNWNTRRINNIENLFNIAVI